MSRSLTYLDPLCFFQIDFLELLLLHFKSSRKTTICSGISIDFNVFHILEHFLQNQNFCSNQKSKAKFPSYIVISAVLMLAILFHVLLAFS